jgi:spermidine synthase
MAMAEPVKAAGGAPHGAAGGIADAADDAGAIGSPAHGAQARSVRPAELALLVSVFVVAACGLVYELIAGALASYLLGDSVLQFSTVIGAYLFAMGAGSWASRYLDRQLVAHFLRIELLVALIGGLLPLALFALHAAAPGSLRVGLYGLVFVIGALVGLEIPLVMRILKRHFSDRYALKDLVSQVLTVDYLGALAVSVAFPLVLVPQLGLARTGAFFGLLNAGVAVWALWLFRGELRELRHHAAACAAVVAVLLAAFVLSDHITTWAEDRFYADRVVIAERTPYQRIVVTAGPLGHRLFLNGNLQFHTRDEHRYHEALVHPGLAASGDVRRVLVLGGGDGLAVREVLRHPRVEEVTLVELDPAMTRLFSQDPVLRQINQGALSSSKVRVINADAYPWLEEQVRLGAAPFDAVIIDFPDPTNFALGKLYSVSFYRLVEQLLAAHGFAAIQTTSPWVAPRSYWTVVTTLEAAGLVTTPYHAHVPSFGEWGFVLAGRRQPAVASMGARLPPGLRFLDPAGLDGLFHWPSDMARVPTEVQRLSNQVLVRSFEAEWGKLHE